MHHYLFSIYSSEMQVWYLVFLPTNAVHDQSHSLCNRGSTYHRISKKIKVRKMPLLFNILWSQFSLLDLFPELAMLSSCYFQSSLCEAKLKICCLSSMWASKNTLCQIQNCDLIYLLLPSHLCWLVVPYPWSKQNPYLFSFNFFILSWFKMNTVEHIGHFHVKHFSGKFCLGLCYIYVHSL